MPCEYNFHWFYLPPEVSHGKCLRKQKYALRAIHNASLEYPYHSLIAAVLRPSHGVFPVELHGFLLTGPSIAIHFLVAHAFEEEEKSCPSHIFERHREVDRGGQSRWGHEAIGDVLMDSKCLNIITICVVLNESSIKVPGHLPDEIGPGLER